MSISVESSLEYKINHAKDLIQANISKFNGKSAVACSFGKDSVVLVHLAQQVKKDIPIFSIMTPYKPNETYDYKSQITKLFNLNIKTYRSKETVPDGFWKTNPDECCRILKVEPTKEAVKDLDCWFSGLRCTEGKTRTDYSEIQKKGNLVKVNPILYWTEADIWKYFAWKQIPVHPWYLRGYRSLGCKHCTSPGGVNERDGRWNGTSKCGGECGIHTQVLK